MSKPLFILQSVCRERGLCRECRSLDDDMYRKGWEERYRMPPGWPACPFKIPMGYRGDPRPVTSDMLGIVASDPESPKAQEVMTQVRDRADVVRPVCLACPGKFFRGLSEDGLSVDCGVGYTCCGGGYSRGYVYLGTGRCHMNYWNGRG